MKKILVAGCLNYVAQAIKGVDVSTLMTTTAA
jgi:hypothetical protein